MNFVAQIIGSCKRTVQRSLGSALAVGGLLGAVCFASNLKAESADEGRSFHFVFHESGQNISATQYFGSGYATHLGSYASVGVSFGLGYDITYTSPNGEELFGSYTETQIGLVDGILFLELKGGFSGGTGKYAGATGTFEALSAVDLADGAYNAAGGGHMTLGGHESE